MAYIDRELMCEKVKEMATTKFDWSEQIDVDDFEKVIKELPTADVVEVKHGEWEKVKYIEGCLNPYQHTCGACGKSYFNSSVENYPYCPICGAKMDSQL